MHLKRKNERIVVTDRDLSIFRFLYEQKVASQKNILDKFFLKSSKQACVKRMQKLVKAQLIEKFGICHNNKTAIAYSLKDKSFMMIKHQLDLDGTQIKMKSDAIYHDIELSRLRVMLESFEMVQGFYPENRLQSCLLGEYDTDLMPFRKINSDAALKIRTKKGSFFAAFEYERSIKQRSRYAKKFLDYYLDHSIPAVFYFCESKSVQNIIREVDKAVSQKHDPKVFTFCKENVQDYKNELPFINSKNGTFLLK
jgi:DNA-binding Lrp family transcriptional regulator